MPELSLATHVALPLGLGLLGFVEPCAVGGHMVLIGTLAGQPPSRRLAP